MNNSIGMDYLQEAIVLGIDVIIFGLCLKGYHNHKNTIKALKEAPQLAIDKDLNDYVGAQKNRKIPYAIVRGTVEPIGKPLQSIMSPSVTGVLQVIKVNEHRITRGFAGFWTENRKLFHVSSSEVPFKVTNKDVGIEIIDALSAEILDLDIIHDSYEPSSLSFFDHVFGFFSGIRQRGLQTTEEILRDGSFITAVGELELDGNHLKLQESNIGPMFLTTATKSSLIRRFEQAKNGMLSKVIICGTIAGILTAIIIRKIYLRKKQERVERKLKESLEKARRERRQQSRAQPRELRDDEKCVVCVENPKEVICLPCGHVCLCEDCSAKIKISCPVCRATIDNKSVAFIS
ncbi:mitochondrial E3 ubiquitin protein ligase 1 [Sitodiplosis mosellana]|uniref:mitochondrial E3 ubiquitin protein ligase 1 n=1 Tax=Sitodiplosis mosellana TaxID=263140 RepID=UPI002445145A|nr:mitochondrial E3 ubiquitin protein ligase 1 [Sitodiplosis mosellana]